MFEWFQVMGWHWTADKSLHDQMITQLTEVYMGTGVREACVKSKDK